MAADYSPIAELARILTLAAMPGRPVISSVDALAEAAGVSPRALQYRCQAARVIARDCVRFVQCLNAVLLAGDNGWDPAATLPITDARTLDKVLSRAGVANDLSPTIPDFIHSQQFLPSAGLREAVLSELKRVDS